MINNKKKILMLRGGYHKEFAYKTMFREGFSPVILDKATAEALRFADAAYLVEDIWNTDEMFELSIKAYEENGCSGIVSFLDSSTLALGKLSDYFGLDYYNAKTADILSNKIKVRQELEKNGLNHVRYKSIHQMQDILDSLSEIDYPFVVKPSDRSAGKGVLVIQKENDIDQAYQEALGYSKNKNLIMEEYIHGKEYCAELMIIQHVPYLLCISEKTVTSDRYCIELVDITPAPSEAVNYEYVETYLAETVKIFDFNNGIMHIEFKLDMDGQIKLIEINPRCAGGNLLESLYHLSGYNAYKNLFYLAAGNPDAVEIPPENISRELDGYMLYNTFLHHGKCGKIKEIQGVKIFNQVKKYDCETFTLHKKVGDCVSSHKNNEDALGTIYLKDMSYQNLKARNEEIEGKIKVLVNS